MRRERYFFRYLYKWLILIFFIFGLVSILFNTWSYIREKQDYSEIVESEQQERINYLARSLDAEFVKLKITAHMILKDDEVLDLFCKYDHVNSFERNALMEKIQSRCMEICNRNDFVSSCIFYLPDQKLKIDGNGYESIDEESAEFMEMFSSQELITISNQKPYIVDAVRKNYKKDWDEDNILGIFVIELNTEQIQKELQFAKMTDADVIFLTGMQEDTVLFSTDEMSTEGEDYRTMQAEVDGEFFRLYYLQDQTFIHLITQKTKMNILMFGMVILLIILIASILFDRRVYHPLEVLLVDAFGQIKASNFSYRIPLPEKESVFTNLYQNFNYMAERIDSLVSRELKQKILVNQANFKHLQAQINPHFMYNSYFLLYRMMKNGDKEGSLLVCENLGKFFKYINRDSGENKSLAEEIAHARSYAIIQGYRYQHIIQIDFPELPEKYGYIEVPRLIIQPLIENVFKYVVSDLDDEEEIKLRVHYEETEEHLIVCVENSGEITEEQLGLIKNKLTNQEEQEDITALMNISSRLNVLFRQEDSVMVSKSKMGGLKIELRLKL